MEMIGAKCSKEKFASYEVICGVIFKDIFEVISMKAKNQGYKKIGTVVQLYLGRFEFNMKV